MSPVRQSAKTSLAGVLGIGGLCVLLIAVAGPSSRATAQVGGDLCLSASPPAADIPPHRLRFGITPLAAGSAGLSQGQPKPENQASALAELGRLRPGRRQLVLRLNRMLMSDGVAGVQRYAGLVDEYAREGFDSELQVRYHPPPGQEGDMAAWKQYVETAVSILGKRPSVKALTVTNEANFPISPNTSDGSYAGVRQAIVAGVLAARHALDRMGRSDVQLGFSFAWRWLPNSDAQFWRELGSLATPAFRQALDYVGLQIYPGLVYPPGSTPGAAGDDTLEALTLLRDCYMPQAGLGRDVDLWVTENGYATNLARTEPDQDLALRSTIDAIHRDSGALGVTDYRWFNLRDNDSAGTDLFDAVGLLRDDYSEKPAFATYRSEIERLGTDRPEPTRCGKRLVTLLGTPGRDRIHGSVGPDVIATGGGADRVSGGRGNDRICSGAGHDVVRGGPGADTLVGGSGPDVVRGGTGHDRCPGVGRRDRARGCEI
jgi:hypothetical protein